MATPPPPVRLRLVYDSGRLLRRAQRVDGLRRCWLLLRPELATIADLANHVAVLFRLGRSCPNGVVLSMDGFTLPPFESTNIFRDNDILRVKQKSCKNMIKEDDMRCVQDALIVEKRPLPIDDKILAIEYKKDDRHQEEQDGYEHHKNATIRHNMESNDTSLKRKCQDSDAEKPESSRRKKLKFMNPEKDIGVSNISEGTTKTDRNHQTELNCDIKVSDGNAQSDTKKVESRSARRKKLKRKLRQKAKAQLEKSVQEDSHTAADIPPPSNQDGFPCPAVNQNESYVLSSGHKTDEDEPDSSEDIVPIVVRPGHIRFGRPGGEQDKALASEPQGTFQWNGTMNKKKGQKWGMNNLKNKNSDMNGYARITGSSTEVSRDVVDSKTTENGSCGMSDQQVGEGSIDNSANLKIAHEEKSSGGPLDFERFFPLTRLPKEGDLIAYRLVELSSSWCPELSSYHVGKVLIYDPISLRIILLHVPEYPIVREERKTEDESDMLVDMSPYKEDGSLEIEYSSLLDVRLLKGTESAPAVVSTPFAKTCKKDVSLAGTPNTLYKSNGNIDSQKTTLVQNNTTSQSTAEKALKTVWEKTGEVANDKPDVQENGWGNWTPNASTSAWSLRALRSSAIGPTVALLRGKNNRRGKPSNRKYGK